MAEIEDELVDAGAEIVWVLEADESLVPGTAERCMEILDDLGSDDQGWCVGDGETLPEPGVFDDSPFSVGRGFDMIVAPATMEVLWTTSHGSPSGNDNVDAKEILDAVEAAVESVRRR